MNLASGSRLPIPYDGFILTFAAGRYCAVSLESSMGNKGNPIIAQSHELCCMYFELSVKRNPAITDVD